MVSDPEAHLPSQETLTPYTHLFISKENGFIHCPGTMFSNGPPLEGRVEDPVIINNTEVLWRLKYPVSQVSGAYALILIKIRFPPSAVMCGGTSAKHCI